MAAAGLTHSQLATKLLVEGCLASIAGNVQGKMPVAPVVLTELQRADIGLAQGGHTLFYSVPPSGVFFDLAGHKSTVWFTEADASAGLERFDAALKGAFKKVNQISDTAHPSEAKMRLRAYEVDFGNARLALIEVEYPERGAPPKKFVVRVIAQARRA